MTSRIIIFDNKTQCIIIAVRKPTPPVQNTNNLGEMNYFDNSPSLRKTRQALLDLHQGVLFIARKGQMAETLTTRRFLLSLRVDWQE